MEPQVEIFGSSSPVLPGMAQVPSEFDALCELVERVICGQPRHVLEIGVWQGGTLLRFARRWPGAFVLGVDPAALGVEADDTIQGVPMIVGDSHDAFTQERVRKLHDGPWDFVHIDGDHSDAGARADYTWAADGLQARVIALHDIAPYQHPDLQVWRLWHELKQEEGLPSWEIRHDPNGGYGYGVVVNRG